uniref:Uncharacterized protein n=1 Tax=Rhizophora mucronata TaxID=61149 RepID=A0A2P2NSE3_RHIMU
MEKELNKIATPSFNPHRALMGSPIHKS